MASPPDPEPEHRELAIAVAKSEELATIVDNLHLGAPIHYEVDKHLMINLYKGTINVPEGDDVRYYMFCMPRQGPQCFGIYCSVIFAKLRPRYAATIGCCCGKSPELKIGDVAVGAKAFNYDEGKWTEDGKFLADPTVITHETIASWLPGWAKNASMQGKIVYCEYISGSAVRKDAPEIFERTVSAHGQTKALDMEAATFLEVCRVFQVHALGVFKGVSDLGDKDKDDRSHGLALSRATDTALAAIKDYFKGCEQKQHNNAGSPARQLAQGYFKNFVSPVVQRLSKPYGDLALLVETDIKDDWGDLQLHIAIPEAGQLESLDAVNGYLSQLLRNKELVRLVTRGGTSTTLYCIGNGFCFDLPRTLWTILDLAESERETQLKTFSDTLEAHLLKNGLEDNVYFIPLDRLREMLSKKNYCMPGSHCCGGRMTDSKRNTCSTIPTRVV